jgi:integrase
MLRLRRQVDILSGVIKVRFLLDANGGVVEQTMVGVAKKTERLELTDELVTAAPAPASGHRELADEREDGLRLRIRCATKDGSPGARTWFLSYKPPRQNSRYFKLGNFPAMDVDEARSHARGLRKRIKKGADPQYEQSEARGHRSLTVGALIDAYQVHKKREGVRTSTEALYRGFTRALAPIANKQASTLPRHRIADLLATLPPVRANRVLAHLRAASRHAVDEERLDRDITAGLKRTKERPRKRVLQGPELRALFRVLETERGPIRLAVWLLLVTAQRVSEVLRMDWSELELVELIDTKSRTLDWGLNWNVPAERRKGGEEAWMTPLPPRVVERLCLALGIAHDPALGSPPPTLPSEGPVIGLAPRARTQWVKRLQKKTSALGVAPWRIHDLRRTAATELAKLGTSDELISLILSHSKANTVTGKHYQMHERAEERRIATAQWIHQLDLLEIEAHLG